MTPVDRRRVQRLLRLLDYRHQRTTEAQQQLAEATQLVLHREAQIADIVQARHVFGESAVQTGDQLVPPSLLDVGAAYLHWLDEQAEHAQKQLAAAQAAEEQAREQLLAERQEERKIERLYDRWVAILQRATLHRELQLLDEAALQRHRTHVEPMEDA